MFQPRLKNIAIERDTRKPIHALRFIIDYVQKHISVGCCVERITMLKVKYMSYLQSHFPDVYNPKYKTYKLKDKLVKAFGNNIHFWQPNYKSELVFSKDVPKGAAVETAFVEHASSGERKLQEAVLILRREVLAAYANLLPLPWPPSSTYLLSKQIDITPLLLIFTKNLLSSKKNSTIRSDRLVLSLCHDICYNLTNGQWKTPKHLLLGMSLRHITGSSKVVTFFNRLGNCVSHSTLLELETAMCDSVN